MLPVEEKIAQNEIYCKPRETNNNLELASIPECVHQGGDRRGVDEQEESHWRRDGLLRRIGGQCDTRATPVLSRKSTGGAYRASA